MVRQYITPDEGAGNGEAPAAMDHRSLAKTREYPA
jgi:hypothetical protein